MSGGMEGPEASGSSGKSFTGPKAAGVSKTAANSAEEVSGLLAAHRSDGGDLPKHRANSSGSCFTGNGIAAVEVKPVPSPKLK